MRLLVDICDRRYRGVEINNGKIMGKNGKSLLISYYEPLAFVLLLLYTASCFETEMVVALVLTVVVRVEAELVPNLLLILTAKKN